MATRPTRYDPATKAAVMAALLSGQAIPDVAREYQVPEGTLKAWKSRQKDASQFATVATDKKEAIGTLLLDYLQTNLATLKAQAVVFSDIEWLKKQGADELAVLHGVMTDKAIRLLEAVDRAELTPAS